MPVRTYDPKMVVVSVGGIPLRGYAEGSYITIERSNDMFVKTVGADGMVVRTKSNDESGTVTVSLSQTSVSNDVLSIFAALDARLNLGVKSIIVADVLGTTLCFGAHAWIRRLPSAAFSTSVGTREWAIDCAEMKMLVGSSNVVRI